MGVNRQMKEREEEN